MPQVLTSEQQLALMAAVWPSDPWRRRACSTVWLAQDICPVTAVARASDAAVLKVAVPLLPQRFNGPCGLLAAVQAEMLLVAADSVTAPAHTTLEAAVERMLQRAALANADSGGKRCLRSVTRLLCGACGSSLAASAPVEDTGDDGIAAEVELECSCACGCPASMCLNWSGRLWCTLQCTGCGARSCVDCAQVEYEKVQFDGDDNCDSVGGGASVPVRSMPPVRTGLGEALLLLYSLVLSASSSKCDGPMIDIEVGTQAVGCAAEMITLAIWGIGRVGSAPGAADLYDNPDVFKSAAAAARGRSVYGIGVLIGSSSLRESHAPDASDPTVWAALSGGHWRVVTTDQRLVEMPCALVQPSSVFPAMQIDGLPRSKTRSSVASITLVTVAHTSAAPSCTPPPACPSAPLPLARIIGRRGAGVLKQLHAIWESGHALESAMTSISCSGDAVDKWYAKTACCRCNASHPLRMYCPSCFFANERERAAYGDPTWRNCFNAGSASRCQSCSEEVSVLRRSRWFNEDVLEAVSAEMVSAYFDATGDLMELPLRGRWPGARVVARCEDVIQCCNSVSSLSRVDEQLPSE